MSTLEGVEFGSSAKYTIIDEIGRGGMGIVYLAEKDSEGVVDSVVLKTIRAYSPEQEQKLKVEANVATGLRHENIVKTYGLEAVPMSSLPEEFKREIDALSTETGLRRRVGRFTVTPDIRTRMRLRRLAAAARKNEPRLFLMVMDYIEGTDLRTLHVQHARQKRLLPVTISAFIASRVCRALAYAHDLIVHRDVSPENVLINEQGVVKLSDFGIASAGHAQGKGFSGKITYASPEQLRGEPVDRRTDVYSLGMVLYLTLTGRLPYKTSPELGTQDRIQAAVQQIQHGYPAPHEADRDIPVVLSGICMRMLEPNLEKRYATAGDAGNALEQAYLYAKGFGPTNNSLGAYLDYFFSDFQSLTDEHKEQLSFLRQPDGSYAVNRTLTDPAR